MFLEKLPFWGEKKAFYPKTKVVPKTLSYCKTDKKIIFKIYYFGGHLWGSQNWQKKAQNNLIHETITPLKDFFF